MDLRDTLAVVTGATEGIGRAISSTLGRAGAKVAICARTQAKVESAVRDLKAEGIDAVGTACDVRDPEAVKGFAQFVKRERGAASVLVNNAGIGRFARLEQMTLADWDAVMATNLRSLFLVTQAFLPDLKAAGGGAIVNIASLAGRNGFEEGTAYCASKHGVLGFAKALMAEVRKDNIRVVTVCPGSVATPFMAKQSRFDPKRERILKPEDVADAVLATLTLPDRAMISELDIRPTNP